ncbi:hypothetical protein B4117_3994 [Bacillus mycoides]|nr:hypothetical protein B4083_3094 [Bacillus cereus]KZE04448.1 hypothetical protein B4117_3994 [Bacillus mycoides]
MYTGIYLFKNSKLPREQNDQNKDYASNDVIFLIIYHSN